MDSQSRKRYGEEQPDVSPDADHRKKTKKKKPKSVLNQQEAQAQPSELSADHPQLLAPKQESTTPEDPEMKEKKERKSMLEFEGAESNRIKESGERYLECGRLYTGDFCTKLHCVDKKSKEICFFCGNIGHTLGKCPKSPGAQFANCLLCNERGHLIMSCPQTCHRIDAKAVPANEPIRTFLDELLDQEQAHRANMQGLEDFQKPKGHRANMQGLEDMQKPKGSITRARANPEQAMQSLVATHGSTNMTGEDKNYKHPYFNNFLSDR